MKNNLKQDYNTYGLKGIVAKATLTEEAQAEYLPVIEKQRAEKKNAIKEEKKNTVKKSKKNKEVFQNSFDDLKYLASYLQRQDGIERDVAIVNGKNTIIKVAEKGCLRDNKLKVFKNNPSVSDIVKRDYTTFIMYIKLGNTFARVFNAQRIGGNKILVDLQPKDMVNSISDYVVLK